MSLDLSPNSHRFLFIDARHISRKHQLRAVVNQPMPHGGNPVIAPDRPWEQLAVSHFGTVLFDEQEQVFKFWYHAVPAMPDKPIRIDGNTVPGDRALLCYATSTDGLTWTKPILRQVEFEGSLENNIVRIGYQNPEGVAILHDPEDPDPRRRYKALYWEHGKIGVQADGQAIRSDGARDGICVSFSPDGLNWTNYPENPALPFSSDTGHSVLRDPVTGKFRAYGRFQLGRMIAVIESEDFIHWSRPLVVLEPDEHELAGPPPVTQYYGIAVDQYEGMYVGGLWIYRQDTDGRIDTQLACSRDGVQWEHVAERQTFLPLGKRGSHDDGMVRSTTKSIIRGDEIYIYYGMVNGPHLGPTRPAASIVRDHPRTIGLAKLRRDGFVSLDAGNDYGMLLTKPIWLDGRPLHVNALVEDGGELTVSVCFWGTLDLVSGSGAIKGYERSVTITGNAIDTVLEWPGQDLRTLPPQFVRLRFELRNAKLFSFWFE